MKKQTEEPGLHRVGPNPWDWEYNPARGQRVGFVDAEGNVTYGTVTDFVENEDTGEVQLTVDPDPAFGVSSGTEHKENQQ